MAQILINCMIRIPISLDFPTTLKPNRESVESVSFYSSSQLTLNAELPKLSPSPPQKKSEAERP